MASKNLRIIYNNLIDTAGITITTGASGAASANTPVTNMLRDTKSLVWRSITSTTTTVKVKMVVSGFSSIVGGIILPFCNLSTVATIRVRGYTGAIPTLGGTVDLPTATATGTQVFDTGAVIAAPIQQLGLWNWGTIALGANGYSYGGGTYGRVWLDNQISCTSLLIEIDDTNTDKYIEISRLVIGSYWSPKYNTSYGLSNTIKDLSAHERSESGDLITNRGVTFNTMNFDLTWLTPADRLDFTRIIKGNGLPRPLLISLFPDNAEDWAKEQAHQIYGKLSQLSGIQHSMLDTYSTQIEIEEI